LKGPGGATRGAADVAEERNRHRHADDPAAERGGDERVRPAHAGAGREDPLRVDPGEGGEEFRRDRGVEVARVEKVAGRIRPVGEDDLLAVEPRILAPTVRTDLRGEHGEAPLRLLERRVGPATAVAVEEEQAGETSRPPGSRTSEELGVVPPVANLEDVDRSARKILPALQPAFGVPEGRRKRARFQ
jgi:hypothetical protein